MRLLIFGASGGLGRHLVAQAIAEGHTVRAFLRDARRLTGPPPAVECVTGDVLDAASVLRASERQQAVLCALGTMPETQGDLARRQPQVPVCSVGTGHIVAAMRKHAIARLIVASSASVGESYEDGRWGGGWVVRRLLGDVMRDKERQEALVRTSELAWTIVRPVKMHDGVRAPDIRVDDRLPWTPWSRVARADVAAVMLRALATPSTIGRSLTVSA